MIRNVLKKSNIVINMMIQDVQNVIAHHMIYMIIIATLKYPNVRNIILLDVKNVIMALSSIIIESKHKLFKFIV